MYPIYLCVAAPLLLLIWPSRLCLAELPAPENVEGTELKSGGNFNITWTYNLTNIEGFTIYKNGKPTSETQPPSPNQLQSQVIGGEIGVTVIISVSAKNFSEESPRSREISLQALPHSPINVIVIPKSYDKALVQWTHGGEETTGFYIRVVTDQVVVNGTGLLDPPDDLTSRQEHFIDVVAGNVYNISVINQYQGWDSPDFNPITYVACPSTPTSVQVTNQTLNKLELSWTHGGGPVTNFVIYNNGKFVENYPPTNLPEEQSTVIHVSPGFKYSLTVASEVNDTFSEKSETTTVVISPAVPQLTNVENIDVGKINVQWTHDNGIFDSFKIELTDKNGKVKPSTLYAQPAVSTTYIGNQTIAVIPGQKYSVTVKAVSYDVPSDPSDAMIITAEPLKTTQTTPQLDEEGSRPSTPTSVSGSVDSASGKITVEWSHAGGNVTDFLVVYQYSGQTNNISHTPGTDLSQRQSVHTDTEPGYEYRIWVLSRDGQNPSAKSKIVTVVTKPSVPISVSVTRRPGQALVGWQPGEGGADKFIVFSNFGAEDSTVTVPNDQTAPFSTALTTSPGETYSIWVKAETADVPSDSSNVVKFTSDPSAPLSVTTSSPTYSTMSVSWKHGGGKVDRVEVTIESTLGTETKNFTTEDWEGSHTVDFSVSPGVNYSVWVEAIKNDLSTKSGVITFLARPSQPMSVQVSSQNHGKVSVNWEHGGGNISEFVIELEGEDGLLNYTVSETLNQSLVIDVTPGALYTLRVMSKHLGVLSLKPDGYVFQAPVECYSCTGNPDDCGKDRESGDVVDLCDIGEACWIRHKTTNGLATFMRRCESTECTSDYHDRKCQTTGSQITCSKCCTGDACNTGFVKGSGIIPTVKLSLLISCLITLTSLMLFVS